MEKELIISGMHCHHCVHAVRQALSALDGVEVRDVQIGRASIDVPGNGVDLERMREAIEEEGYVLERVE